GLYTAFETMYEEGFSDQQIADALGVSKEMVAKWRRGERLPSHETRRQIMAAHEKAASVLSRTEETE
ncbi:MAG: helix-turn-helix domain-containing protein, partial [Faecousia sp.]